MLLFEGWREIFAHLYEKYKNKILASALLVPVCLLSVDYKLINLKLTIQQVRMSKQKKII